MDQIIYLISSAKACINFSLMESVKFITACPECILRAQGHHMQSLFLKKILTLPTSIANNTIDGYICLSFTRIPVRYAYTLSENQLTVTTFRARAQRTSVNKNYHKVKKTNKTTKVRRRPTELDQELS